MQKLTLNVAKNICMIAIHGRGATFTNDQKALNTWDVIKESASTKKLLVFVSLKDISEMIIVFQITISYLFRIVTQRIDYGSEPAKYSNR